MCTHTVHSVHTVSIQRGACAPGGQALCPAVLFARLRRCKFSQHKTKAHVLPIIWPLLCSALTSNTYSSSPSRTQVLLDLGLRFDKQPSCLNMLKYTCSMKRNIPLSEIDNITAAKAVQLLGCQWFNPANSLWITNVNYHTTNTVILTLAKNKAQAFV